MRLVWAGLGAAVAIAVVYQIGRARSAVDSVARAATPEGVTAAATRGVSEIRDLVREIRTVMHEQERRLTADMLPDPADEAAARAHRAARGSGRRHDEDWDDAEF